MAGSHKRDTDARPSFVRRLSLPLFAASTALVVTGGAVAVGVATQGGAGVGTVDMAQDLGKVAPSVTASASTSAPTSATAGPASSSPAAVVTPTGVIKRAPIASRSLSRTTMYADADLNLWTAPGDSATLDGELAAGDTAVVTGLSRSGRQQVLVDGATRWVTSGHLSADKPELDPADGPLSDQPCPDSSVENGLKPQTIRVYRAVCHAFPQITSYGGWANRSEHNTGNAIDVMTGDKALGDKIAAWAQAHAADFDLYDVIWWDRIWTPVRASEGWRAYGDHGSPTANHMDHVHIGTN
ncbi:MAG: mucin-2 protein [Nocardioides sp.]